MILLKITGKSGIGEDNDNEYDEYNDDGEITMRMMIVMAIIMIMVRKIALW